MAQFTNQAQLTYGSVVANSNIATGEIKSPYPEIKALEDSIKYMITRKYDIDIEELKSIFIS